MAAGGREGPDGPDGDVRIVLSTAPPHQAEALAQGLVDAGLAACVNVVPGLRSLYRWKGAVANDPESLLLAKTTRAGVEALLAALSARHPYEVPEAVVLAPEAAAGPYAAWVAGAVGPPGPTSEGGR